MAIERAKVKANGQVVVPLEIRRRFKINEGTQVVFVEDEGRLILQPVTDSFIETLKGSLNSKRLPGRVERSPDRILALPEHKR